MFGEKAATKEVSEIQEKSKIDVQVDFDANMIFFFNDGSMQGTHTSSFF
jgi:hypothetical protein